MVSRRCGRRRALVLRGSPAVLVIVLLLAGALPYVAGVQRSYLSYLVLAERLDAPGADAAAGAVRAAGGQVVQGYPQIGAVLAYSADAAFAGRLRGRPGIAAVGATRTAPVPDPPGALGGAGDFRHSTASESVQGLESDDTPTVPDPGDREAWNLVMMGAPAAQPAQGALSAALGEDRSDPSDPRCAG